MGAKSKNTKAAAQARMQMAANKTTTPIAGNYATAIKQAVNVMSSPTATPTPAAAKPTSAPTPTPTPTPIPTPVAKPTPTPAAPTPTDKGDMVFDAIKTRAWYEMEAANKAWEQAKASHLAAKSGTPESRGFYEQVKTLAKKAGDLGEAYYKLPGKVILGKDSSPKGFLDDYVGSNGSTSSTKDDTLIAGALSGARNTSGTTAQSPQGPYTPVKYDKDMKILVPSGPVKDPWQSWPLGTV